MAEKQIGKITHFFGNISVGVIELTDTLKTGDKIKVAANAGEFEQVIQSMQIDRKPIQEANAGQSIGVKLDQKAKEGDIVYKVE